MLTVTPIRLEHGNKWARHNADGVIHVNVGIKIVNSSQARANVTNAAQQYLEGQHIDHSVPDISVPQTPNDLIATVSNNNDVLVSLGTVLNHCTQPLCLVKIAQESRLGASTCANHGDIFMLTSRCAVISDILKGLKPVQMNATSRTLCVPGTRQDLLKDIIDQLLTPSSDKNVGSWLREEHLGHHRRRVF